MKKTTTYLTSKTWFELLFIMTVIGLVARSERARDCSIFVKKWREWCSNAQMWPLSPLSHWNCVLSPIMSNECSLKEVEDLVESSLDGWVYPGVILTGGQLYNDSNPPNDARGTDFKTIFRNLYILTRLLASTESQTLYFRTCSKRPRYHLALHLPSPTGALLYRGRRGIAEFPLKIGKINM